MKPIQRKLTLEGIYTLTVTGPDGQVRRKMSFKNLILNSGLNQMGLGSIVSNAQVGSGSTAPVNTDTALQSFVALTTDQRDPEHGYSSSSPYFGWTRITYRFAEGTAAGNLSEVGVGWDYSPGNLFSRALILDSLGSPTTITVLSDEVLDVTYELRLYPPTADTTFTIDISGTSHVCVMRPSLVSSASWEPRYIFGSGGTQSYELSCWTDNIGTQFEQPSGTSGGYTSGTYDDYANNSLKRRFVVVWDLDNGNFPEFIKSMSLHQLYPTMGTWQVSFTPRIEKDNTKMLTLPFEISWARHVI